MEDTNWELVQFKYEILGYSLNDLAKEHSISLPVLEFNAKNWKQIPLATLEKPLSLDDISSLDDILIKLGDQTATRAKAFAILKQKFLGPKYVELETVLLHKAIIMASQIKDNDPLGARTLRTLATVLSDLLQQNPLLRPGDSEELSEAIGREWKVTVVKADKEDDDG